MIPDQSDFDLRWRRNEPDWTAQCLVGLKGGLIALAEPFHLLPMA